MEKKLSYFKSCTECGKGIELNASGIELNPHECMIKWFMDNYKINNGLCMLLLEKGEKEHGYTMEQFYKGCRLLLSNSRGNNDYNLYVHLELLGKTWNNWK